MTEPKKLATIILAAGKGTRMKSDLHKVLHPIAGRPMLDHLLDSFTALEPTATVVVAGDRSDQLEAALTGRDVTVAHQEPQLGTAHAALQARSALAEFSGAVMVCFGDCPMVRADTVRRMLAALDGDTRVVVLGFRPAETLAYGRIVADADGRVAKMVEHKDATEEERACTLCNSGVMLVHSDHIWRLLDAVGNDNSQGEYYLPDVATGAIAEGGTVRVVETDAGEVAGINSRAELAQAEGVWQHHKREEAMAGGASMRAPDTVFFSWDTQIGRDVTIEPNVVFGPGVTVADHATIRAFSHLEGASVGTPLQRRALCSPAPRCSDGRGRLRRQFRRDEAGDVG